jgi:cobaltochelatase CobT
VSNAAPQTAARRQQRIEELCAASIRALTGERELHFRARRLHRGARALPLPAPHLHPSLERDDFASFRGAADGQALRISLSDAALHRRLCPTERFERLVFELLEQFRVEALAPEAWPGVRHNLAHRFERWTFEFLHSRVFESQLGIVLFTLAQVCRTRVTAQAMPEAAVDPIEATRGPLVGLIGHELAGLRRDRAEQAAYAQHALAIGAKVNALLEADGPQAGDDAASDEALDPASSLALSIDFDAEPDDGIARVETGASRVLAASADGYRVFTRAYDRELEPTSLVRAALLREYRERLDARVLAQGINRQRLARELQALLARPDTDDWDSAQDEGLIDGRRLAQLVASPAERRLFRSPRMMPRAHCVVGILIDCSGSMKAQIDSVAVLVDVLARALEEAGATSEVLGFTTQAWNGGRAARDWQRAGCPRHPGRLNEACHLVFKNADTPWRRARASIAALYKADLFREGIDGEAVEWACARLARRDEERRILLVVSDGSPMDSATQRTNDRFYLDHHLRDVVQRHSERGGVEIAGLGVGLDLSPYYERSRALDLAALPGNAVFREVIDLLAGRGRR